SLNAYAECKRKWWFRYACAAVEDRGSSASFYGIAFHAALEEFHHTHTRFADGDGEALASVLDYCVVTAFDRHRTRFDAPVEFELQKRRARRTAKKYLAWLLERARRAPFEVIGCETQADVELGGHRFVGYIDRLDRDERTGTVTVVDYKTGSIATSAEEYLAEVRAFREFQLPFYYWARTAAGDTVTRLALVPLKDALLDVAPVELEVVLHPRNGGESRGWRGRGATGEIAVAELERARERMIALASELSSGTLQSFPATDDPDACRYCAYAEACRERPAVREERFGR
ncbi:MAG TPA: PD-(D/E)XK nuclease family protein, partial [Candidatus Elarobacter sp.]|nr:PD-(D/E)XK nuclease family protein [Candidatus Elarobacter sp.]